MNRRIVLLLLTAVLCICLCACGELPEEQLERIHGMWIMRVEEPEVEAPYIISLAPGGLGSFNDSQEITWKAYTIRDTEDLQVEIRIDGKKQYMMRIMAPEDGERFAQIMPKSEEWSLPYSVAVTEYEESFLQEVFTTWYRGNSEENVGETFVINADGTCQIEGKTMYWRTYESGNPEQWVSIETFNAEGRKHRVNFEKSENGFIRANVDVINSYYGGEYYTNPMISVLFNGSWEAFDQRNSFDDHFYMGFWNETVNADSGEYSYALKQGKTNEELTIELSKDGAVCYVLTMAMDGEYPQVTLVDQQTQENINFYNYYTGYDEENPEARYYNAVDLMYDYMNGYSIYLDSEERYLSNEEKAPYVYEMLAANGDYRQTQEFLDRFTILPGMLVRVVQQYTDQLGNKSDTTRNLYTYDINGTLTEARGEDIIETYGLYNSSAQKFHYDNNGKLSSIVVGNSTISALGTPDYDPDGKLMTMHVQLSDKDYTSTFTYDDQGRIILVEIPIAQYNDLTTYTYTYNDGGKLA